MDDEDFLDDLTEEELKQLEDEINDIDTKKSRTSGQSREPVHVTNDKREDRMFEKRDMVHKLDGIFTKMKSDALPMPKPTGKKWTPVNIPVYNNREAPAKKEVKPRERVMSSDDEDDELFDGLTEDELIELAGDLNMNGLVSQDQYRAIQSGDKPISGGFNSSNPIKCSEKVRIKSSNEQELELDSVILLHCLRNREDDLWCVRINNVPLETNLFEEIFNTLRDCDKIVHLTLAGTSLTDDKAKALIRALKNNTSLKTLNLETNDLTSAFIEPLCRSLERHPTIREFKCSHQKQGLGSKGEDALARLLTKNSQVLKISYSFQVAASRSIADRYQIKNQEMQRQKRNNGEEFYNLSAESKKRDEYPQRWMIPVRSESQPKIVAQLQNQIQNMKPVSQRTQRASLTEEKFTVHDEIKSRLKNY